jgi:hypothetical protein
LIIPNLVGQSSSDFLSLSAMNNGNHTGIMFAVCLLQCDILASSVMMSGTYRKGLHLGLYWPSTHTPTPSRLPLCSSREAGPGSGAAIWRSR